MNLDFSDEQKELRDQIRRFLRDNCTSTQVRAVLNGPEPFDRDLYRGLAGMGVVGAAIPESFGGAGFSYLELCIAAEEIGRTLAPVPMSSSIYLAAEFLLQAGSSAQQAFWLPKLASGETTATFAWVEGRGPMTPEKVGARVRGGRLNGTKAPVPDGAAADMAIVAALSEREQISLYLVELNGSGVTRAAQSSLDPTKAQARIEFTNAPAELLGGDGNAAHIISQVFDRAAVLLAFEQLGGADRALEMARDYALDRMAFGRPIGSFQAIKHMLANMYVAATLARSNCYYGAWALATNAAELPIAAASAHISATNAFQECARNNIQVHGGMGFTYELDCHLFYRRAHALALALGPMAQWEKALITRLAPSLPDAA